VNILGSGFFEDTEVSMGGMKRPATFINNTKLQIGLSAEDLKTPRKYEIMTHNLSPGGGSSNTVVFSVKNPLAIRITGPVEGEVINKARTMGRGTFQSGAQDVGITVNGVVADLTGNQWVANNVPLTQGENIVKALIRDTTGNTAETSITVYTGYISQAIRLSANITGGMAPLKTYFSVSTELFSPITNYQMDFEGDGIVDYSGETFDNINYTYTAEGIFYPTITITDSQGNTYSDTIAITVLSKTDVDTVLKSRWEGMKEVLAKKDVERGLNYFHDASKDVYRKAFNVIIDELPQIISQMQNIEMVYLMDQVAKYRINRVHDTDGIFQTITYYIYFTKDDGGVWRIDNF
jgi:PKD repeat protein